MIVAIDCCIDDFTVSAIVLNALGNEIMLLS